MPDRIIEMQGHRSYLHNVTIAMHKRVGHCDKQLYMQYLVLLVHGAWRIVDTSGNTDY